MREELIDLNASFVKDIVDPAHIESLREQIKEIQEEIDMYERYHKQRNKIEEVPME